MNNLERGNNVSLSIQRDRSLTVQPTLETVDRQKEIVLTFSTEESGNSIIRSVIGSYLNGYSIIKLKSKKIFTVEQHNAIRNVVRSLYMRIIKSSANQVDLQTLMDESMASVYSGIERMHIITASMCQDTLKSMMEWDEDLAKSVVSLEEDVDQFMYFLLRLVRSSALSPSLANQLGLDMVDCLDCQTLVHRIEQVADHTTNIADSLIDLFEEKLFMPRDVYPVLVKSAEVAFDLYDRAVQSFLSKNVELTNDIIDEQKDIERLGDEITPIPFHGEREERNVLCHICIIRDSIKRISEYAADIAELTIDSSFKVRGSNPP
ncbi:MAG: phosphate uptake regulator PhoU [Candidatus Bathyarchaeota archaeon]|nr:MAG: phosphate uptake regulator PhoU [Candidatus Bathyarchaeota archaeon]